MTLEQLQEWEAYDSIDPIGKWRDEWRTASVMALIVNVVSSVFGSKNKNPILVTDFMPDWDGSRKEEKERKEKLNESNNVWKFKQILLGIAKEQNKRVDKTENASIKMPKSKKKP